MRLKKLLSTLGVSLALLFSAGQAAATTCPNATAIASLPVFNQAVVCGTTNDITSSNVTSSCGSTLYYGGYEALYTFTPTTSGAIEISYDGSPSTSYVGIFVFDGCPTTAGTNCVGNVTSSAITKTVTVTVTAGTTYYLMFDTWPSPQSPCPGTFSIATCAKPTAPAVSGITTTDATLAWTGTAPDYQVEYGTSSTLGSATNTRTGAVTNPYTATGLTPSTAYNWWVRSVCGPGDTSSWSAMNSFTTACPVITTYPYLESFLSSGLPPCWLAANSGSSSYNWVGTASDATYGASAPFAGTGFVYLYVYLASTSSNTYRLQTPSFDLSGAGKQLQYYYWLGNDGYKGTTGASGSDPYPLQVLISTDNGATWTSIYQHSTSNSTFATTNSTSFWTQNTISLAAYAGQTVLFRFASNSNYGGGILDQGIDEFTVMDVPSCITPGTVTTGSITNAGAVISWNAPTPAPAAGYRYEVRSSGTAGSGATGLAASGNTAAGITTATVTGLSPVTTYTVYVRGICGPGDTSVWTPGRTFTTACATYAAPFAEGFNTGALPNCWTNTNSINSTTATMFWKFGTGFAYGTTTNGRPAGTFTWVDASSPFNGVVTLASPIINLSSLSGAYVKFDWFKNNTQTQPRTNNNLKLEGYNGTAWVTLFDDTTNAAAWRTQNITLPASFNGIANAQFRFSVDKSLSNNFYDDILLDSFSVDGVFCAGPTGVTVSGITATTATINWTAPVPPPANGYQYEVRSGGVVASGTALPGVTAAFVTGLAPLSTDTVYVRSLCATGQQSGWSTGVAFNTLCAGVPPAVNLGNDTTFCSGNSITLNAGNPGATYSWNPGGASTQTLAVTASGTYSVAVTNAAGCVGRDTIVVTVAPLPVNLGNDTVICGGNSVPLDAGNPGATYLWNTGATTQTITVNAAGTYDVVVTNANGCVGRDTINVTAGAALTVNLGNDMAVCPGAIVSFDAGNPGLTHLWSNGATTQTITVNAAGKYYVTVTNASGCVGSDTVIITNKTAPTVNLGNDTAICSGNSVALNAANTGATYMWNTGATSRTITVRNSGTYIALVTNTAGCVGADTINVTVNPTPVVALGNDTAICANAVLTLDAANSGSSYLWSNGATTRTISVSTAGAYNVRVTSASGCIGRDTINVSINPLPVAGAITVNNQSPVFTFSATGSANVTTREWRFGDGFTDIALNPTHNYMANGTYTVTYYVANGCGADSVTTTVVVSNVKVNNVTLDGQITLFPNPASHFVTVQNTNAQAMKAIRILDIAGAVISNVPVTDGAGQRLDISHLASGIYLLRIELEGGAIAVRRLEVKQ